MCGLCECAARVSAASDELLRGVCVLWRLVYICSVQGRVLLIRTVTLMLLKKLAVFHPVHTVFISENVESESHGFEIQVVSFNQMKKQLGYVLIVIHCYTPGWFAWYSLNYGLCLDATCSSMGVGKTY